MNDADNDMEENNKKARSSSPSGSEPEQISEEERQIQMV